MIHSIHHLSLVTNDLETAAADYGALLGRAPDGAIDADGSRQVWFSTGNIRLALVSPHGAGAFAEAARKRLAEKGEGLWEIALAVDDLDKARHLYERRMLAPGDTFARAMQGAGGVSHLRTSALGALSGLGVDVVLVETPHAGGPPAAPASIAGLDHIVIRTPDPGRAVEFYAGRLGLDLRLDRANPAWGARQLFFRCGDLVVEFVHGLKQGVSDGPDSHGGLSWRAGDIAAARERLIGSGFDLSEVRKGRKPGSEVCTVRNRNHGVPTILFGVH